MSPLPGLIRQGSPSAAYDVLTTRWHAGACNFFGQRNPIVTRVESQRQE